MCLCIGTCNLCASITEENFDISRKQVATSFTSILITHIMAQIQVNICATLN